MGTEKVMKTEGKLEVGAVAPGGWRVLGKFTLFRNWLLRLHFLRWIYGDRLRHCEPVHAAERLGSGSWAFYE